MIYQFNAASHVDLSSFLSALKRDKRPIMALKLKTKTYPSEGLKTVYVGIEINLTIAEIRGYMREAENSSVMVSSLMIMDEWADCCSIT